MHKPVDCVAAKETEESIDVNLSKIVVDDQAPNVNPNCEFERDGVATASSKNYVPTKATKMRFVVCSLALFSLTFNQVYRGVINYCIISMVDPRMLENNETALSSSGSCPMPATWHHDTYLGLEKKEMLCDLSAANKSQQLHITNEHIMVDQDLYHEATGTSDKFMWTIQQQSYVKGGFFYSYFLFMVLGARLSEIYGAKYVLLSAVASGGLINLATPWMARNSFGLLVASRVVLGASQSSVYPAMYALINRWLTMGEMSIYTPMIRLSFRLGQIIAGLVPGLISDWPNVFYVAGFSGLVWSILWLFISTSDPSTNRWVSKTELAHIEENKKRKSTPVKKIDAHGTLAQHDEPSSRRKTPWLKILTSPSVIGLVIVKLAFNLCNDLISVELPSYLKYVHHASMQRISATTTAMFSVHVSLVLFAGWSAKVMVQKRPFGLSKTATRKIFQSLAQFGTGTMLILLTFNGCNITFVTIVLQFIGFFTIFVVGGDMMLPYDLSEEYPATIMAIANSVSNASGAMVTFFTGIILGDQGGSEARWNTVITLIAAADCLGGLIFCILVKAKPIDFESKKEHNLSKEVEEAQTSTHPIQMNSVTELTEPQPSGHVN